MASLAGKSRCMGYFWKLISDNWAVVMIAPGLFVAALALGWLAGWIVVRLFYNQRLAHQQDMITKLRAVLEEKLPASFLPPPPRKYSKQMSFGLVLVFVGLGAAVIGALLVSFDRSGSPTKTSLPATAPQHPPASPQLTPTIGSIPDPRTEPIVWASPFGLNSSMSNSIISVTSIGMQGRNVGEKEVQFSDAYIISGLTGVKMPMKINSTEGMIPPNETNPVPPQTQVDVAAEFEPRMVENS
jgi:hypothetical protein